MSRKGIKALALVLGLALLAAFTLAYAEVKAPEEPIKINSKDVFGKKRKGDPIFDHKKHTDFKCQDCHHTWKEGEKVKKCGECHLKKEKDKTLDLKDAFHDSCMDCHKKLKREKKKYGPTGCSKCHPKKKK
jgi:hypothetical protein